MSKFKEGDEVICVKSNDNWYKPGEKLTVGKFLGLIQDDDYEGDKYNAYNVKEHYSDAWIDERDFELLDQPESEYTGGSSNYYKVFVQNPTTLTEPYEAECNDIIEALKMTFAEGNAFKAIWRKAKARQGVQKKGYDNGLYDSEKVVFFGERMVVEAKSGEGK